VTGRQHKHDDEPTERVTFAYLHEQLDKIDGKVDKLQIAVIVLIAATVSPKIGGPDVHTITAAIGNLF
jgi:hypothetical protein